MIEFAYVSTQDVGSAGDSIESIRSLIRGRMRADYELLITDLGFDEEGMSPQDVVTLAVGMEGEQLGTLTPGDEADYFTLQVQADVTYRLTLESTAAVSVTSGCQDRFGQTNFGVATAEGLIINCDASAGSPCSTEVLAPATEEVLLRLTGTISDPSSALTIQYAISVVEVEVEDEGEAEEEGEVEVVPGA